MDGTNGVRYCPKCGSKNITYGSDSCQPAGCIVTCYDCGAEFDIVQTEESES